jgi:ubiquinone/menaquinone biosynthesis C-methylase UbiE
MKKTQTILGIGSGTPSTGHVFLEGENIVHVDIAKNAFHVEVQCDAHKLPFQNECFDIVHISHVLEHVRYPYDVLKEVERVTKKYAIIKVPNASHYRLLKMSKEHIYSWTPYDLENLLKNFFCYVKIREGYRIINSCSGTKLKRKLNTLKTYLIALLFRKNEIIAICEKNKSCSEMVKNES